MPITIVPQKDLGQIIGSGLAQGIDTLGERHLERRKEAKRKQELLAKRYERLRDSSTKDIMRELKASNPDLADNTDAFQAIKDIYLDSLDRAYSSGSDLDIQDLLGRSIGVYDQRGKDLSTQAKPDFFSSEGFKERGGRLSRETQTPVSESALGSLLQKLQSPGDAFPNRQEGSVMDAFQSLGKPAWQDSPEAKLFQENPSQLLKEIPVGLTQLLQTLGFEQSALGGRGDPAAQLASQLREGLTPEQVKGAEGMASGWESLGSFGVPLPGYKAGTPKGPVAEFMDFLKGKIGEKVSQFGKKAASVAEREAAINAEGILSGSAAKTEAAVEGTVSQAAQEMLPTKAKPLAGRVSEKAPKPETLARVERQEARPFKKEAEIKLREKQLKQYPEYEEDILKDRAKMLENREKLVPKTERGLASQQSRMAGAQADLPGVQKVYQSTAARVRALENQLASQPGNKQIQEVLAVAKNELKDAEFLHKQTLENAKLGSSRVGKDAMRDAARKKTMEISEKIANGEEVELAKMDYNPELVKKGKEISKRKPLEAKKVEDFHTQVHDTYGDVYRERLGQLDKQIKELAKNKSLSSLHQRQVLDKERQALKKLIDHTDAESAIHRHNLALRERFERQKAASRFKQAGKSTPVKETKKTQEAVKGKFDMKKTTQEASSNPKKAAEDLSNEATRQNPKQAEQISKEAPKVAEILEEAPTPKEQAPFIEAIGQAKTPEEAVKAVNGLVKDWKDFYQSFKKGTPAFYKTKIFRSFATGFAIDSIQNSIQELTGEKIPSKIIYPLATAAYAGVGAGSSGALQFGSRAGVGGIGGQLSNQIWKFIRKARLRGAAKERRSADYAKLAKKYGPKLTKEAMKK